MSLSEAILDVAERLERKCEHKGSDFDDVRDAVRELRLIVKASEGTVRIQNGGPIPLLKYPNDGVGFNIRPYPCEKEERLQAQIKEQSHKEEVSGESMVELVGGPLAGDMIHIPGQMPVGAKTSVAGFLYQLRDDRKLYHVLPKAVS